MCADLGTIATTSLALFAKLPDATSDLSSWNHWRMPVVIKEVAPELERGPVLVTVEYSVAAQWRTEFLEAMHQYQRVRRRAPPTETVGWTPGQVNAGVRQRQRPLKDTGLGPPSAVKLENSANMADTALAEKLSARAGDSRSYRSVPGFEGKEAA
jgi:hypothetical protein